MRRRLLLTLLFSLAAPCLSWPQSQNHPAPDLKKERSISIAVNPIKPFIGLINLEIEYQLSSQLSFHIFVEYLFQEADHPDFVLSIGPRYYFIGSTNVSGLYNGINLDYLLSKEDKPENGFAIGGELGHKLFINKTLYILPRGLVTYTIGSSLLLPGFELLGGVAF